MSRRSRTYEDRYLAVREKNAEKGLEILGQSAIAPLIERLASGSHCPLICTRLRLLDVD
jgi:hypothetical protein